MDKRYYRKDISQRLIARMRHPAGTPARSVLATLKSSLGSKRLAVLKPPEIKK